MSQNCLMCGKPPRLGSGVQRESKGDTRQEGCFILYGVHPLMYLSAKQAEVTGNIRRSMKLESHSMYSGFSNKTEVKRQW